MYGQTGKPKPPDRAPLPTRQRGCEAHRLCLEAAQGQRHEHRVAVDNTTAASQGGRGDPHLDGSREGAACQ